MHVMRFKFGDRRRNDWKCCFCCHVRTGTIFLGIWHLMLHVLALSIIAVVLRNPQIDRSHESLGPALPTPLSEVEREQQIEIIDPNRTPSFSLNLEPQHDENRPHLEVSAVNGYRDFFGHKTLTYQDLNVGIVVTFCTFGITLLMVYGAIKGKPSYLMPFFCLQVFDFCIASLTAVGYLCYLPDIHRMVAQNPHIPFRDELLRLNPQCLSLLVMLSFMVAMMAKAYFIGVVWSCYKYLTLRMVAAQRTIHFIDPDSQSLLPDLPDYETAMGDPRYVNVVKKFPTPPPSYESLAVEALSGVPQPAQAVPQAPQPVVTSAANDDVAASTSNPAPHSVAPPTTNQHTQAQ